MSTPVISVQGLEKSYGTFQAVRGINFEVHPGAVFGLLGPNGAGKTSTLEILEDLRPRTAGDVNVLGLTELLKNVTDTDHRPRPVSAATQDTRRVPVDGASIEKDGVDCIKGVFDAGQPGYAFNRASPALLAAMAAEARTQVLPVAINVADAIAAGTSSIEHGSMSERIPDETFARMAQADIYYDPTLSVLEEMTGFATGRTGLLEFSLVQQAVPAPLFASTRKYMQAAGRKPMRDGLGSYKMDMKIAADNLRRAHAAGVRLVTGTGAAIRSSFTAPPCIAKCSCGSPPD